MNTKFGPVAGFLLSLCVLACDTPPPAQCLLLNDTNADMTVRISSSHALFPRLCTYSESDWLRQKHCMPVMPNADPFRDQPEVLDIRVEHGGAVRLASWKYPDIEENIEGNFLIDGLEIYGDAGDISWVGRREIFSHLKKEGGWPLWWVTGSTPRYIYYYK